MFPCVCECVLFTMCHNSCFMMPTIDKNKSISSSVNKLLKVLLLQFFTLRVQRFLEALFPKMPRPVIRVV